MLADRSSSYLAGGMRCSIGPGEEVWFCNGHGSRVSMMC